MAKKIEVKVKLRFKASPAFQRYHANPDWLDGDVREVGEEEAKYLMDTFPEHFKDTDIVKEEIPEADSKETDPFADDDSDNGPDVNKNDSGPDRTKRNKIEVNDVP
jgi:hypothetical protein